MLFPMRETARAGIPGVWITEIKLQNPPSNEKLPPVNVPPASAWPIVPVT